MRVPWTSRRSNQSSLKGISPEYSLEGPMLTQKLQYFGHLMRRADSLGKTLMLERLRAGGEGEDRRRDGWVASSTIDESEQTPQNSEGQGNLVCCSPWSRKEQDTTEQQHILNLFIFGCVRSSGCLGFSLVVENGGHSLTAVRGLLFAVASLVAECRLQGMQALVTVAPCLAQQLWHTSLVALQHVGSSCIRGQICVFCIGRWTLHLFRSVQVMNIPDLDHRATQEALNEF